MLMLKQSTAVTVKIGPFVDDTDGKTAETGLTLSQADIRLSKNGGNIAQKNESTAATHDELGVYDCPLDATDTGTLGRLQLWVHESGALPVWHECMVLPANVWDSLFGADKLQVHADEITNGLITAAAIATDAIDADAIKTDALDEIADAVADEVVTSGHAVAGSVGKLLGDNLNAPVATVDTVVDAVKAKTDLIPASPAAVGSAMTLADDAITAGKFDESTAFPLKSADAAATAVARVGADGDTLETLSDQADLQATAAELAKVKGAVAGKCIVNAAGTQVQLYDAAGSLLVTLDRTGTGPYTWTPTWA